MADDRPATASPSGSKGWLRSWGSKKQSSSLLDEKLPATPQTVSEPVPVVGLLKVSEAVPLKEAEAVSPRSLSIRKENDTFIMELSKQVLGKATETVMTILASVPPPEPTSKPDPRLAMSIIDALCYISTASAKESIVESEPWRRATSNSKTVLCTLADQACAQFGSVFLRGIDASALVRLLRSDAADIRNVCFDFFRRLFVESLDKPWTMSHREKRTSFIESFVQQVNADANSSEKAYGELYQALQLFLTSSLLNSVTDAASDPALDFFEAERGYDAMMTVIERNPELSEQLLDCLRCLTFLGGNPKDFEEAFHLARSENTDEPIQEAKNPASFAAVSRLVSKMLSSPSDQEPYKSIRLPLLHCVMSVYSANPKNFGILERQFQILAQLSRRAGEPDPHDEVLFMTVKLFELVALGLEYRPVTAVTVLCDVSLPVLAKRGDARTFNVLSNTMVKLVQRHPSLALDCGLLRNLIFPLVANASRQSKLPSDEASLLLDSLVILAASLERHQSASSATKPIIFKNNCSAARASGIGQQCKDIILTFLKAETGKDVKSPIIASAVQVMVFLARDSPDNDLTWIMELIQHPSTSQSSAAVRFRTSLFQHSRSALSENHESWTGTAAFDCVLTCLLSLDGAFSTVSSRTDEERADMTRLLMAALSFLSQATRQMRDRKGIDFDALFSVLKLTQVLQNPSTASTFVDFVLKDMVVSPTGSSIADVDPLVLLGCIEENVLESKAKIGLFEKLSELVANDGEFSSWNRQQLARFRLAERILETHSEVLVQVADPLHSSLTRIVSCVGNQCATPELVDKLLRLAYRVAPGDADGSFELTNLNSTPTEGDRSNAEGANSVGTVALHQTASTQSSAETQPTPLECVLLMLQLVVEPKVIGRHAVLGSYVDDDYDIQSIEFPIVYRRHWPPGTSAAVSSGGLNVAAYSFSCWLWLAIGNNVPNVPLVTISSNSLQLLKVSLRAPICDDDPGGMPGHMMDSRRLVSLSTSNSSVVFEQTPELYPGRWHHVVVVHRRAEQKNIVASFWAGNQDAKGGPGRAELYINGAFVESQTLNWPHAIESQGFMSARFGDSAILKDPDDGPLTSPLSISRWRLGPSSLFEGAFTPELVAGLFMRGPAYRGSLTKVSPMIQDKRAIVASAFERMHLLARDDDFVNRIGGQSSETSGWRNVQKFALHALGSRIDPKALATILSFDPDFHEDAGLREVIPLPMQESLNSVGGASCAFLPLFLRVGVSLKRSVGVSEQQYHHASSVLSLVLSLMRDSLRGSDRARFAFRLEDGHRVMAWLLHLVSQARDKPDLETFRIALSFSTTGTGFDATIIDPEALFFFAMNDHVWRRHDSPRVAWKLVAELLPWLTKLVHPSNRHSVFNFAALQPLNVFEWVLSTMILLVADNQPGHTATGKEGKDGKDGFDLLWMASSLLETLLRHDPDSAAIVFQYVLVTLSSASTSLEDDDETIIHLLVKANRLLSSLADQDQAQQGASDLSDFRIASPGAGGVTLDDLRCALLDVLINFRRPPPRATLEEIDVYRRKLSRIYEQYGNGDWLGCIMEYSSEDYQTVRRVLAVCEVEFSDNLEFAKMFMQSKSFKVLCDALNSGRFCNDPEILLFWARLVTGTPPSQEDLSFADKKLVPRESSREVTNGLNQQSDSPEVQQRLDRLQSQLTTVSESSRLATSIRDQGFTSAAYEALHLLIRDNYLRSEEPRINEELVEFLWRCSKSSPELVKLWTSQVCLRALVKTVFIQETYRRNGDEAFKAEALLKLDPEQPARTAVALLIDLITRAGDPAEALRLAASSFPDDASLERLSSFQALLFEGLLPHAMRMSSLATVLIQRTCIGWTPGFEVKSIELALECPGVHPNQIRSAVLCTVDRNFTSKEDDQILEFLMPILPRLLSGQDADAFVACLVRCIFSFALDQVNAYEAGTNAVVAAEPSDEILDGFKAWKFFCGLSRITPDSVRKLLVSDDLAMQQLCNSAGAVLGKTTPASWLVEYGAALRPIITLNANTVWSREMERHAGRWYVAGRIPASSGDSTLQILVEMIRSSNPDSKGLSSARVRGWTTPRDRSDTFLTTEQARKDRIINTRKSAFKKQEQLFFAKFEDLLRGKKSWSSLLRRAQLPSSSWQPFGGRHLEIEENNQRWKLDPFEDPSRARRRLRQNRTFYKRYKLVRAQQSQIRRDISATSLVDGELRDSSPSPALDETALDRVSKTSSPFVARGKKRASSISSTSSNPLPPLLRKTGPGFSSSEIDPAIESPANIVRALRKPQPFQRVRTHTLVTTSSAEAGDADEQTGGDIDDVSTIGSGGNGGNEEISGNNDVEQDSDDGTSDGNNEDDVIRSNDEKSRIKRDIAETGGVDAARPPLKILSPRLRATESSTSDPKLDEEPDSPMRQYTSREEFASIFGDEENTGERRTDFDDDIDKDYVIVDIRVRAHQERVRAELDPHDRDYVTYRTNCSTVRGLEERRGLCLVGRTSLYVVDNYELAGDGTIAEVDERNLDFHVQVRQEDESILAADDGILPLPLDPLSTATANRQAKKKSKTKTVSHRKRRVRYDDILDVFRRRFLFRDVGLEVFSSDGSTLMVVLETKQERDRLQLEVRKARKKALLSVDLPFAKIPAPPGDNVIAGMPLDVARRRWLAGSMSNFDYLTLLNTLAGRSYNDPAQYLVFPWVLADYESPELDLTNPKNFRDLSKPMGALTQDRIAYVTERYSTLESSAEATGIPPFHFGTHYSCSGYVANYLFRLEPFSRMALQLQGGAFDRADRLFRSVEATWKSASGLNLNMQDVRELVPEFYCMHEFLQNRNRFELGVTQRGAAVGDVELPLWAKGSASEFIRLNRKALESKHVSEHLHEWIDLVFGFKQRGREAIKATNVFHPLTYEGEVDLDAITDPSERAATMEQIHSFGQTPTKLFEHQPHPKKEVPTADNWSWHSALAPPLVVPGNPDRPLKASNVVDAVPVTFVASGVLPELRPGEVQLVCLEDLPGMQGVSDLTIFQSGSAQDSRVVQLIIDDADKVFALKAPQGLGAVFIGNNPSRYVSFGGSDGSLDIHTIWNGGPLSSELVDKVLVSFEQLHRTAIAETCIIDDGKLIVTGGMDGVVCIWRVRRGKDSWRLEQEAANVGHRAGCSITSLDVCPAQGLLVSGSDDCTVNVWDLGRRQEFIRTLRGHERPVRFIGINEVNGNMYTVCEREAIAWHVNGDLLARADFRANDLSYPTAAIALPCYSHQSGIVMVVGHNGGEVSLWDLLYPGDKSDMQRDDDRVSLVMRAHIRHGACPVVSLAMSRDRRMLVSADLEGNVKRWASLELLNKRFRHLAFPPGGIAALPGAILANAMAARSGTGQIGTAPLTKSSSGGSERPVVPETKQGFGFS